MYIKDVVISKFKNFKFSNIKMLLWENIGPTSIILGKNGSGKSSLINACLPLPMTRSYFDKDGSIRTEIEHRNELITVGSDYTEPHSPHSFKLEGTELNLSGTTKIQQELIEKYLGLTPTICKLLTVGTKITELTPSLRKTLLSELNPANTSYALEKHKLVNTKLKSIKSNLVMLYTRKDEIESKLIKEDLLLAIKNNRTSLLQKRDILVSWTYVLDPHISSLQQNLSPSIIDENQVSKDIRQINLKSISYKDIDREGYLSLELMLNQEKAILLDRITGIQTSMQETIDELNKYQSYLTDNKRGVKEILKEQVTDLENYISTICLDDSFIPIHRSLLESTKVSSIELEGLLRSFVDVSVSIPTESAIEVISSNIRKLKEAEYYTIKEITRREEEQTTLAKLRQNKSVIIPDNCLTDSCDLYKKYNTYIQSTDDRLNVLEAELIDLKKQLNTYRSTIDTDTVKYDELKRAYDLYRSIVKLVKDRIPGLLDFMRSIPIEKYTKHPFGIIQDIKTCIQNSEAHWAKVDATDKLMLLQKQILDIKDDIYPPIEFIHKLIDEKKEYLENKRQEVIDYQDKNDTINQQLELIDKYKVDKKYIEDTTIEVENFMYLLELKGSITYYKDILSIVEKTISSITTELEELNLVIREQDDLISRKEGEILSMITKLEAEQKKYQAIERALSPTHGFPHKYMVSFINSIINNMNVFINKVFSYPLTLYKLDENSSLNYEFSISVGGTLVTDISQCSDGQRAIIDLAFCLASIVQLKLTDYPLFLDEIDRALDVYHKQELLHLLAYLLNNDLCKQIFIVGHGETAKGLNGDEIVLDPDEPNTKIQYITY